MDQAFCFRLPLSDQKGPPGRASPRDCHPVHHNAQQATGHDRHTGLQFAAFQRTNHRIVLDIIPYPHPQLSVSPCSDPVAHHLDATSFQPATPDQRPALR